jgi:hypothetical protein
MFGAPIVSCDFIRSSLNAEPTFSAEEDNVVSAIASQQITELLKTNKTFLIDGGMNTKAARVALERKIKAHDYGRLTVWVQTDEPTSRLRSMKRSDKRAGDAYNTSMSEAVFNRYQRQFAAPTVSENVIVISGKHTFASQAKVALRKLVAPREDVVPARPNGVVIDETKPEQPRDIQPRRRNVIIS